MDPLDLGSAQDPSKLQTQVKKTHNNYVFFLSMVLDLAGPIRLGSCTRPKQAVIMNVR
jgi:hypothetical protein